MSGQAWIVFWLCGTYIWTTTNSCHVIVNPDCNKTTTTIGKDFFSNYTLEIPVQLECESPSADLILQKMVQIDRDIICDITGLVMEKCNITKLLSGTFDFNVFTGLRYLKMNSNRISVVPENLFNSLKLFNLGELYLCENKITFLSQNQFVLLYNLKILDLSDNEIKVTAGTFASIPSDNLQSIQLTGNELTTLPEDMLAGKVSTTLRKFLLRKNKITNIPHCVSQAMLPSLEHLDISHNNLHRLPKELFNSSNWTSLVTLYLHYNNISFLPLDLFSSNNLKKLRFIKLSHNKIEVLPDDLFQNKALTSLQRLDLSFNQIREIPRRFLKNQALGNLTEIKLNNNYIKIISKAMFPDKLPNLCLLDLSHNRIASIGEIVPAVLSNKGGRCNNKRCILNVSYNALTVQETSFILQDNNTFQILGYLDVSYNNISKFELPLNKPAVQITVPDRKKWICVTGNKFFNIINLVYAAMNVDLNDKVLHIPYLRNRHMRRLQAFIQSFPYSYNCDCEMLKYLELRKSIFSKKSLRRYQRFLSFYNAINSQKLVTSVSYNDFKNLRCGSPKHLNGKYLYQLNETQLQCQNSSCTKYSKCICIHTPFNGTVRINCTAINLKYMPNLEQNFSNVEYYLGHNEIYQFPILLISETIVILDLSYNFIRDIPNSFFSYYHNVKVLNLAGNRLLTIPSYKEWNNMNSLHFVELRSNNYICNCSGLTLKQTLISLNMKLKVTDISRITCYSPANLNEQVIYEIPNNYFGCPYVNLVLILTVTLTFLLTLVIAIFVAYVFRYYIRLFLFVHFGWRFFYSYSKDQTVYDVFISYSAKDSDWVMDQLVDPLESRDPPYKLCIHERDFIVGIPICDNITNAVEGSKCIVIVVSRNWIESDWCKFEFRVAHCLAKVENQTRLLVILKEKIPDSEIKGDLRLYMKTFTYLDSANQLFWPRLLNDLPAPYTEIDVENGTNDMIELT